MSDPTLALHAALFNRLKAELSCPVFDSVPDKTPYPYVVLDYEVVDNTDSLNERSDRRLFYFSVWSDYRGQVVVKTLNAEIDAALHNRPFPLTTGRVASISVTRKECLREPDGVTFQGAVTVLILTEH